MNNGTLAERLQSVNVSIDQCLVDAGRRSDDVRLIAVSKNQDAETVLTAYKAGQRIFGENRIQELEQKRKRLTPNLEIEWHMIGHLQTNKVRIALTYCRLIHSVDSFKLLDKINKMAEEFGKQQHVLLQVNVAGENTKYGFAPDALSHEFPHILKLNNIICDGLMTMAPLSASDETLRTLFATLRKLRDKLEADYHIALPHLSMGMSNDYRIAIQEGATFVRIGRGIFGARA